MDLDWNTRTAIKFAMIEDLLAQLYAARYATQPEPVTALRRFAEGVQARFEATPSSTLTEAGRMHVEAEYAHFFELVAAKLQGMGHQPPKPLGK